MNKVGIVVIAVLASCACAEIFYPKNLTCSHSAVLNTTNNGQSTTGHMWGKDDGVIQFFRMDLMYTPQTVSSTVIRCDKKDKDGNCFKHASVGNTCTESYTLNQNGFSRPFEYDYKMTVPCPVGEGECTKYCHNISQVCYTANSEDLIIAHEMGQNMSMIINWVEDEYFTMDKFVFITCDGNHLPYPVNPCNEYTSSAGSQSSSSSVPPTPKPSSTSSVVKASFIVVLAALLISLF